jgi:hypothetical protein
MTRVRLSVLVIALGFGLPGLCEAGQRVFVASGGSDANAPICGPSTPCRSFTTAMSAVDPGGEIVALDAAGYGAVTVTKSVSIIANPGFYAGITVSTGDAVTIATAGVNVLLRGLNINGIGGTNGINMTNGASLTIDNCVVANFSATGVKVDAASAKVKVANSAFNTNGSDGLLVAQGRADVVGSRANGNGRAGFGAIATTASATATLSVTDSIAAGNVYGFASIATAASSITHLSATRVTGTSNSTSGLHVENGSGAATGIVGNSSFTENAAGLNNVGGTLKSLVNNLVELNTANTSGSITTSSGI